MWRWAYSAATPMTDGTTSNSANSVGIIDCLSSRETAKQQIVSFLVHLDRSSGYSTRLPDAAGGAQYDGFDHACEVVLRCCVPKAVFDQLDYGQEQTAGSHRKLASVSPNPCPLFYNLLVCNCGGRLDDTPGARCSCHNRSPNANSNACQTFSTYSM